VLLSSARTEPRPFLLLTHPTSEGAGGHKQPRGDAAGTADSSDAPDHRTLCPAYKAGEEGRGDSGSDGVCLPKEPLRVTAPCSPGDGRTQPADGKR